MNRHTLPRQRFSFNKCHGFIRIDTKMHSLFFQNGTLADRYTESVVFVPILFFIETLVSNDQPIILPVRKKNAQSHPLSKV